MNDRKNIRAHEWRPASEKVKQNRAQAVDVGSAGKLIGWAFGLLGRDVARCSKRLQRSCQVAGLIEPFCQPKVAHHRFGVFIKENVSRLKITMENSLTMCVGNAARDLCHQPHTLARLDAKRRCRGTETSARRVFHAEEWQALLSFTDLVNRKNVWMIK